MSVIRMSDIDTYESFFEDLGKELKRQSSDLRQALSDLQRAHKHLDNLHKLKYDSYSMDEEDKNKVVIMYNETNAKIGIIRLQVKKLVNENILDVIVNKIIRKYS